MFMFMLHLAGRDASFLLCCFLNEMYKKAFKKITVGESSDYFRRKQEKGISSSDFHHCFVKTD